MCVCSNIYAMSVLYLENAHKVSLESRFAWYFAISEWFAYYYKKKKKNNFWQKNGWRVQESGCNWNKSSGWAFNVVSYRNHYLISHFYEELEYDVVKMEIIG